MQRVKVALQGLAVAYQSASASSMTRFKVIGLQIRLYLHLNIRVSC
jgi:hypothetical protein